MKTNSEKIQKLLHFRILYARCRARSRKIPCKVKSKIAITNNRYEFRSISAIQEVRLSDVRLTADQWEEVAKEIKQPHNKLRLDNALKL